MAKNNDKSKALIDYDEVFNFIGTPKFIIWFDVWYILVLIILPFILSLLNWWHFSKITPNQMLSYVGSIASAFCTINLALLVFAFNLSTKKEKDYLKKRTYVSMDKSEYISINLYDGIELSLDIPLKIKTDYIHGKIVFEARALTLLGVRLHTNIALFHNPDDIITIGGGNNTDTPQINIRSKSEKTRLLTKEGISDITCLTLQMTTFNDDVTTPSSMIIGVEKEKDSDDKFKITYVNPV